ncbi:hypothetical protein MMC28_007698 [Mycoblastus sanguinarius]|nr:hypothetical protein [Mycoblastus sanguinarius]
MAAVSTYSGGGALGSHGVQEREPSPWDFSTPANPEQTDHSSSRPFISNAQSSQQRFNFNPVPSQQPNGISQRGQDPSTPDGHLQPSTNGQHNQSKAATSIDPTYLSPYRQGYRPGLNESRSDSEADSLIDLYGHPRSVGEKSLGESFDKSEKPVSQGELFLDDEDPERSRWIHRDKLAMIESHEMQEAGIKLPPQRVKSIGKSKSRRDQPRNENAAGIQNPETEEPILKEGRKRRTRSPQSQEEDEEQTLVNDFDIRTPEEIAADSYINQSSSAVYRQQDLRKNLSRIPLPRSSPVPIPQEHIERSTPLPRKRGASGNWNGDEESFSYHKYRSRNDSVGSQAPLNEYDIPTGTPTPASRPTSVDSPSKPRAFSTNRTSHARKPSNTTRTPETQPGRRSTSAAPSPRTPSSAQRPKSRSGLEPRPATAVNRPEGDAPWLATMYKPDPRLPQDQQLLPTHAKRLQQEQWDKARRESEQRRALERKPSPQLPREFSPLAEHTVNGLQPSSRDTDEKELQERGSQWPLTVATPGAKSNDGLSGAEGRNNAGYSPIPKVKGPSGSPIPSPKPVDPFERERMAREGDVGKGGQGNTKGKEKGCGCCIIM